ncbi:MAG: PKD domain-containing protein [Myxococcales bacterium]|nr:PKD domain-containing protein [Myxococcales bacterium]
MRLEGAGAPKPERARRLGSAALVLAVAAAIVVPAVLYYTRGRKLPLRVLLEAQRYVVGIGERVALTLRVEPKTSEKVELSLEGAKKISDTAGELVAPTKIGLHTVTLIARVSGTRVKSSITIRVVPRALSKYKPLRPPPASSQANQPTSQATSQPASRPSTAPAPTASCAADKVIVHGTPCAGCVVSVERVVGKDERSVVRTAHRLAGVTESERYGRVATLTIPRTSKPSSALRIETEIVRRGDGGTLARCTQTRKLPVLPASALSADFRWQLISPGYFRLAARPPRSGDASKVSYSWRFDDNSAERTLNKPRFAHRFSGKRQRYHLVTLTVTRGAASASATRVLVDRTVSR